jgi:hypothetical protein
MSATNSLHYQLCCEGAKYLLQPRAKESYQSQNKIIEIIWHNTLRKKIRWSLIIE